MPLDDAQKNHPICDTDIWVKSSKHKFYNNEDLIFNLYNQIHITDAVRQELGRDSREKYVEDFKYALVMFKQQYECNKIKMLRLTNSEIFNKEEKKAVLKAFADNEVYYDENLHRFLGRKSGVGEKVSIIYASVLEIPIILSDDGDSKELVNRQFPYLQVINYEDILFKNGYKGKELMISKQEDNKALKEVIVTEEHSSKSSLSNKLLSYKSKFSN